jgi:exopolysaccharide production protein ExoQ
LLGFHANRNSTADAMLVGIVACCLVWAELRRPDRLWTRATLLVLVATLLLGLFLTGSRTGIGLAPIALGFGYALARHGTSPGSAWLWVRNWRIWLAGSTILAAGAATAALLADRAPVARVLARFDFSKEFRPEIWRDSWHAALQFWPWGSGLGTFDPAFLPSERLEVVDHLLPNRAHNEVLELAVEGGLPLLAAWLVAAGVVLITLKRHLGPGGLLPRRHALFAAAVLSIAGFHSLVDYPLRSMAMASLVALAAGMVLSSGDRKTNLVAKMTDSSQ